MDLSQSFFSLFDIPEQYDVDVITLGDRYRSLQNELHPDRFSGAAAQEQRMAVQYSAFVNQAYQTLKNPLARALYLLQLAGWDGEKVVAQKVAGDFLMEQIELREKLESARDLVDPEPVLDHLMQELQQDWDQHGSELRHAMALENWEQAASAVVKMQYLDKLRAEVEALEAQLLDS